MSVALSFGSVGLLWICTMHCPTISRYITKTSRTSIPCITITYRAATILVHLTGLGLLWRGNILLFLKMFFSSCSSDGLGISLLTGHQNVVWLVQMWGIIWVSVRSNCIVLVAVAYCAILYSESHRMTSWELGCCIRANGVTSCLVTFACQVVSQRLISPREVIAILEKFQEPLE